MAAACVSSRPRPIPLHSNRAGRGSTRTPVCTHSDEGPTRAPGSAEFAGGFGLALERARGTASVPGDPKDNDSPIVDPGGFGLRFASLLHDRGRATGTPTSA